MSAKSNRPMPTSRVRHKLAMIGELFLFAMLSQNACSSDVFNTQLEMPPVLPQEFTPADKQPCSFGALGIPLLLDEAIERSMCNSPKSKQVWLQIKAQAAQVGISKGAYLPTASASIQSLRDQSSSSVQSASQYNSANRQTVRTQSVSANWVLYDFGVRSAALKNSEQLLIAALSNHDAVLQ